MGLVNIVLGVPPPGNANDRGLFVGEAAILQANDVKYFRNGSREPFGIFAVAAIAAD